MSVTVLGILVGSLDSSIPFEQTTDRLRQQLPIPFWDKYTRCIESLIDNASRPLGLGKHLAYRWFVGLDLQARQPYLHIMFKDRRPLDVPEAKVIEQQCFPNGVEYPLSICGITVDEDLRNYMAANCMNGMDWSYGLN